MQAVQTFIANHQTCPVCDEPLTIYAKILDGSCWKGEKNGQAIRFTQAYLKQADLDGSTLILENGQWSSNDNRAKNLISGSSFFLFALCNPNSFANISNNNYEIDPYLACYHASMPFMFMANDGRDPEPTNSIRNEMLIFKRLLPSQDEKMYLLDINYETSQTVFYYCQTTPAERSDQYFEPVLSKQEFTLLAPRPDFDLSRREELYQRFDTWLNMG